MSAIRQAADTLADLRPGNNCDLVDHEGAPLTQPVLLVGIDSKPDEGSLGRIGRERANRHGVRRVEAIILDNHYGTGLGRAAASG